MVSRALVPAVSGIALPAWALQWEDSTLPGTKRFYVPSSYHFIFALFVLRWQLYTYICMYLNIRLNLLIIFVKFGVFLIV